MKEKLAFCFCIFIASLLSASLTVNFMTYATQSIFSGPPVNLAAYDAPKHGGVK